MKKAIILLFMAIAISGVLQIKKANATWHGDLFDKWEGEFKDHNLPRMQKTRTLLQNLNHVQSLSQSQLQSQNLLRRS